MKSFDNILFVPLTIRDEPPVKLRQVVDLSLLANASLTVYGVVPDQPQCERSTSLSGCDESVIELVTSAAADTIQNWAEPFSARAIIGVEVAVGVLAVETVRTVLKGEYDLVIVAPDGTEEHSANVKALIRSCPCPVLVLRGTTSGAGVLAAIDPDDSPSLNRLILEYAQSQVETRGGTLHVVHAWHPYGDLLYLAKGLVHLTSAQIADLDGQTARAHRGAFQAVVDDANVEQTATHLIEGQPATAIAGLVESYDVDLVVMGSFGKHGFDRVLVANTAEQLLGRIDSSLLVVKPPGFVSPIRVSDR